MAFPVLGAITAFFIVDLVVMGVTGKDIIQHTTGIDIYSPIVDPIVNFLLPAQSGGWSLEDVIANQDLWGNTIMDALTWIFIGIVVLGILIILTRSGKKR
ncbi:MAG: hypothetical protein FWD92_04020 [Methanomassiliicoccaceae archaeon]|nr:hypothetical protein [Methanomassiliicoccaceae archaeon]